MDGWMCVDRMQWLSMKIVFQILPNCFLFQSPEPHLLIMHGQKICRRVRQGFLIECTSYSLWALGITIWTRLNQNLFMSENFFEWLEVSFGMSNRWFSQLEITTAYKAWWRTNKWSQQLKQNWSQGKVHKVHQSQRWSPTKSFLASSQILKWLNCLQIVIRDPWSSYCQVVTKLASSCAGRSTWTDSNVFNPP